VDGYRRTLRAALEVAVRRGLLAVNPARGRMDAVPDPSRSPEPELRVWEPEQTAVFLAQVAGDRLAALYELAAYAGLRRAELCGLRWADIDPDETGLRIRQTIVEVSADQVPDTDRVCGVCGVEHVGRVVKHPKSRTGRRWVPLASPAREALRAHRAAQDTERSTAGDGYRDHALVFCTPQGDPLRPSRVSAEFTAHVRACNLQIVRLQDTRHGACSLLLAGGVPIEVVQMILGHASPTVTRRIYAHLLRTATAAQVETATQLLTRHRRPPDRHQGPRAGEHENDES
jgi:integrase